MPKHSRLLAGAAITVAAAFSSAALAQGMTHGETVKKALQMIDEAKKQKGDGGPPACSLLTRADVKKATGRDPLEDGEQMPIAGGTTCKVGDSGIIVMTGPDSWQRFENYLKAFKAEKDPRKSASGFGDRAYWLYPTPRNSYQREFPTAMLVVQRGQHTLALSQEAERGKPADSTQPVLTTLMKTVLGKLP
jgi:hypothetical protein